MCLSYSSCWWEPLVWLPQVCLQQCVRNIIAIYITFYDMSPVSSCLSGEQVASWFYSLNAKTRLSMYAKPFSRLRSFPNDPLFCLLLWCSGQRSFPPRVRTEEASWSQWWWKWRERRIPIQLLSKLTSIRPTNKNRPIDVTVMLLEAQLGTAALDFHLTCVSITPRVRQNPNMAIKTAIL